MFISSSDSLNDDLKTKFLEFYTKEFKNVSKKGGLSLLYVLKLSLDDYELLYKIVDNGRLNISLFIEAGYMAEKTLLKLSRMIIGILNNTIYLNKTHTSILLDFAREWKKQEESQ